MSVTRSARNSRYFNPITDTQTVPLKIESTAHKAGRRRYAARHLRARRAQLNHSESTKESLAGEAISGHDSWILDQLETAIITTDMQGHVTSWNRYAETMYGWTRAEAMGRIISELLVGPREAGLAAITVKQIKARGRWEGEFTVHRKDGTSFPAYVIDTLVYDEQNLPSGIVGVSVDISERKANEQKIREHAALQTQLFRRLLYAHEAERRRLSMDIHDGPLQSLGVSLMALDRAVRRYERGDEEKAIEELKLLRTTLASTVGEIRAVLADLSDEVLNTYGLSTALARHVERFGEITGIEVEMSNNLNRRLPADTELLMYRLAQEAMANIRKHSQAQHAKITLQILGNTLYLKVADDGKGFDIEGVLSQYDDGKHLGLKSMRERVQAAGGDLAIASAPGKGTVLEFQCPVPPREQTLTLLSEEYLNSVG